MKLMLAFLDGRYADALNAADRAEAVLSSVMALSIEATFHFFHVLTLAAIYPDASAAQQQAYRRIFAAKLKKFDMWAEPCPANYRNPLALAPAGIPPTHRRPPHAL